MPADENNQMRGEALDKLIRDDLGKGLIPFYVSLLTLSIKRTLQKLNPPNRVVSFRSWQLWVQQIHVHLIG